jgi:nitrate reductase gamma subunit
LTSWRIAPGTVSKPKVALAALLATGCNAGAYFSSHRAFAVLAGTALLYRFMAQAQMRKVSIRMTAIALLSWLALTAVLSAGLIMMLIKSGVMDDAAESSFEDGEVKIMMIDQSQPENTGTMSAEVERYVNLIMPFVWFAGPSFLVRCMTCCRIDSS